jgi:hypothetical protein
MAVAAIGRRPAHPKKASEDPLNLLNALLIHAQHHELVEWNRGEYRLDKR